MPNIVTHAYVTAEVFNGADQDLILGSTLPDFVGMYRDYSGDPMVLSDIERPPAFVDGIKFHQLTDGVFDGLKIRQQLLADAAEDCAENTHVSPRVARTLANIATDILVDVAVIESNGGQFVYQRLKAAVMAGNTALSGLDRPFEELVTGYFRDDRVNRYKDSEWLAKMLQHRFSLRRAKIISLSDDELPSVVEVLARQTQRIREQSVELLADTINGVSVKDIT